jgi:hypothetical protein
MPTASTSDLSPTRARPFSLRWWIQDRDGQVVLAQPPNAAILVWLASVVVRWTNALDHRHASIVAHAGQGALLAWALDETARGTTPARRVLGAIVSVWVLVRLLG